MTALMTLHLFLEARQAGREDVLRLVREHLPASEAAFIESLVTTVIEGAGTPVSGVELAPAPSTTAVAAAEEVRRPGRIAGVPFGVRLGLTTFERGERNDTGND